MNDKETAKEKMFVQAVCNLTVTCSHRLLKGSFGGVGGRWRRWKSVQEKPREPRKESWE